MGIRERAQERLDAQAAAKAETKALMQDATDAVVAGCPDPGKHYMALVNKGSLDVVTWTNRLNGYYANGYRLAHVFEQDSNTVQVLEHSHP